MNEKLILAALTLMSTGAHAADIVLDDEQVENLGIRTAAPLEADAVPAIEATALALLKSSPGLIGKYLTNYCVGNAETNIKKWWDLADFLVTKYNDGYIQDEEGRPREIGYPESWLRREAKENPQKGLKQKRKGDREL